MRRVPTDQNEPDEEPSDARKGRRKGLAYQGASEAVFAIPVATGIGYWLDGRFGTSPYLLILGAALGFAAFVTRLLRLGKQLQALGDGDD